MSVNHPKIRLVLITSVTLLGAILLFLGFSRTFSPPSYPSTNGPFSFRGNSLQHVFNQTLGVSATETCSTVAGSRDPVNR